MIWNRVILAIAFALLMGGTLSNSRSRRNCGIAHHRLLSIGGILCFIHGLFAVAYYISATAVIQEEKKLNQPAAAAGAQAWVTILFNEIQNCFAIFWPKRSVLYFLPSLIFLLLCIYIVTILKDFNHGNHVSFLIAQNSLIRLLTSKMNEKDLQHNQNHLNWLLLPQKPPNNANNDPALRTTNHEISCRC